MVRLVTSQSTSVHHRPVSPHLDHLDIYLSAAQPTCDPVSSHLNQRNLFHACLARRRPHLTLKGEEKDTGKVAIHAMDRVDRAPDHSTDKRRVEPPCHGDDLQGREGVRSSTGSVCLRTREADEKDDIDTMHTHPTRSPHKISPSDDVSTASDPSSEGPTHSCLSLVTDEAAEDFPSILPLSPVPPRAAHDLSTPWKQSGRTFAQVVLADSDTRDHGGRLSECQPQPRQDSDVSSSSSSASTLSSDDDRDVRVVDGPDPRYQHKLEFAVKRGYNVCDLDKALAALGLDCDEDSLLKELIQNSTHALTAERETALSSPDASAAEKELTPNFTMKGSKQSCLAVLAQIRESPAVEESNHTCSEILQQQKQTQTSSQSLAVEGLTSESSEIPAVEELTTSSQTVAQQDALQVASPTDTRKFLPCEDAALPTVALGPPVTGLSLRDVLDKTSHAREERDSGPVLRHVIIDGSNVAMSHGKTVFSCRGIQLAVDWFRQRGHGEITVFVPQWRKETSRPETPITDQHLLRQLEQEGVVVFTPARRIKGRRVSCYDDRFVLRLAADTDGVVVSNDNYRDLVAESQDFRQVVETRQLMYTFVADRFMPPEDPMGRRGPTLDTFLRKSPHSDHPALPQLCPYGRKCTFGAKCKFHHPERAGLPAHKTVSDVLREQATARLKQCGGQARGDLEERRSKVVQASPFVSCATVEKSSSSSALVNSASQIGDVAPASTETGRFKSPRKPPAKTSDYLTEHRKKLEAALAVAAAAEAAASRPPDALAQREAAHSHGQAFFPQPSSAVGAQASLSKDPHLVSRHLFVTNKVADETSDLRWTSQGMVPRTAGRDSVLYSPQRGVCGAASQDVMFYNGQRGLPGTASQDSMHYSSQRGLPGTASLMSQELWYQAHPPPSPSLHRGGTAAVHHPSRPLHSSPGVSAAQHVQQANHGSPGSSGRCHSYPIPGSAARSLSQLPPCNALRRVTSYGDHFPCGPGRLTDRSSVSSSDRLSSPPPLVAPAVSQSCRDRQAPPYPRHSYSPDLQSYGDLMRADDATNHQSYGGLIGMGSSPDTQSYGGLMGSDSANIQSYEGLIDVGSSRNTQSYGGLIDVGSSPNTQSNGGLMGSDSANTQFYGGLIGTGSSPNTQSNGGLIGTGSSPNTQFYGGLIGTGSSPNTQSNGGLMGSDSANIQSYGGLIGTGSSPNTQSNGGLMGSDSANTQSYGGVTGMGSSPNTQSYGGVTGMGSSPNTQSYGGVTGMGSSPNTQSYGGVTGMGSSPNTQSYGGVTGMGSSPNTQSYGGVIGMGSSPNTQSYGGVIGMGSSPNTQSYGGLAGTNNTTNTQSYGGVIGMSSSPNTQSYGGLVGTNNTTNTQSYGGLTGTNNTTNTQSHGSPRGMSSSPDSQSDEGLTSSGNARHPQASGGGIEAAFYSLWSSMSLSSEAELPPAPGPSDNRDRVQAQGSPQGVMDVPRSEFPRQSKLAHWIGEVGHPAQGEVGFPHQGEGVFLPQDTVGSSSSLPKERDHHHHESHPSLAHSQTQQLPTHTRVNSHPRESSRQRNLQPPPRRTWMGSTPGGAPWPDVPHTAPSVSAAPLCSTGSSNQGGSIPPDQPILTTDPRYPLYYHLCGIFAKHRVRAAMNAFPHQTDPTALCAIIMSDL